LSESSIAIIGAGIVGASTALALQKDGYKTTLLDRQEPCAGASFGNAGVVVNAACVPTAMPGIVFDAMRMLTNPQAPLSIKPAYFHRILPWLVRFVLESRSSKVKENSRNLHALTSLANDAWRQLTDGTELNALIDVGGWLKIYESERSFSSTDNARALMDEVGTPYALLTAGDIQDLEPQLAPIYARGILQEDSLRIINPQRMVQGMVDLFVSRGGKYETFDVRSISVEDGRVELRSPEKELSADKAVIAAGAWSGLLANQLGDKLPLDSERGYHLMLPKANSELLNRPVMNGDAGFVLAPMETGLRLTGQVEFAGLDAPPDYRRIRGLLPAVSRMLPGVTVEEDSVWMGCRPSLPDSLPVIGFASNSNKVVYAFGHQHLGMTLGPLTGLIVADLLGERDRGIDLTPYRPERF
jgi:glycine/D-amino acid oxidase-like deaminating enzyme